MQERVVHSGRMLGILGGFPAPLLSKLHPGLFLDVGAAVGAMTRAMRRANPDSRVIAYEPFAGNLPYLEAVAKEDPGVTIRPVAVLDRAGTAPLCVYSVIGGGDKNWADLKGASFVGEIGRLRSRRRGNTHRVPTVRLDDEVHEHVRFLKIDVQSLEFEVLSGARELLTRHGVDIIYAEFMGDPRVLRLLNRLGYRMFDGIFMLIPTRRFLPNLFRRKKNWKFPNWPMLTERSTSLGLKARHGWPPVPCRGFLGYSLWFYLTRLFRCVMKTDLLCVHESYWEEFQRACIACAIERERAKT